MRDYVTVRIPEELRLLFEKINKEYNLGYTSFAEFVKDAIRKRVESLYQIYYLGDPDPEPAKQQSPDHQTQ